MVNPSTRPAAVGQDTSLRISMDGEFVPDGNRRLQLEREVHVSR